MSIVGIICEYNPFHNGHAMQLDRIRADLGSETSIVCLMSGNYVQRGEPAIFPKQLRSRAAVMCGADLVLELPMTAALSSAEGFAAVGVSVLTALGCEYLSFGSESGDQNLIMSTAKANLDPRFDELVRQELAAGCSYPAARQRALEVLVARPFSEAAEDCASEVPDAASCRTAVLQQPNDILAIEYCKAILRQGSPMQPLLIRRPGSYHEKIIDRDNPAATAIRIAISNQSQPSADWKSAVPSKLHPLYDVAPIHTVEAGESASLAILRTLPDESFRALPFGAEGLWSKLMKNARSCASIEEILSATKSKRYTFSRIRRMLLCAVLGLTETDLKRQPTYVRILAFNQRGRSLLREMKPRFPLVHAGETPTDAAYYALETRAADLYSLFSTKGPRPAGEESRLRVEYVPDETL